MSNNFDYKYEILLKLLKTSMFGIENTIDFGDIDLLEVFKEAKKQTVLAYTFASLPPTAKENDPDTYEKWENLSFSIIQNNYNLLNANVELDKFLESADIPHSTLKGFASAYYYDKPHLRQMGDIDLLVYEKDMDKTVALLESSGYTCLDADREHEFHIAFKKNKILYEIHTNIVELSDSDFVIDEIIKDIIPNSQKVSSELGEICIPNRVGHAVIMLLHLRRHMRDGDGIGLRHLCDWAAFANTITDDEWVSDFEPVLTKIKIKSMAMAFSKSAHLLLEMPEKEWFKNYDKDIASQLIDDILLGGNFGKSDTNRKKQKLFIDGRNNAISSMLRRFFQNVYCWKPFFKKHKILLPIGSIIYFFRTITLVILGKRYRISLTDVKDGVKRSQLYNELFKY